MDMPVRLDEADPNVKYDRGKLAVCRGPLVYCLEETDNQGTYDLPLGGSFSSGFEPDLLGGVVSITSDNGQKFIPYYSWDNRAPGRMKVWVDCP